MMLSAFGWLLQSEWISFSNHSLPWNLDSALFVLGFYAFGHLLSPKIKHIIFSIKEHPKKAMLCILTVLCCVAIYLPMAYMNGKVSIGSKNLNNGFVLYFTGIVGFVAVLAMSILMENNRFLLFCGRNSLFIMSVHTLIRRTLQRVISIMGFQGYDPKNFLDTIIPFITVLTLSILLTTAYNRLRKITLNREGSSSHKKEI